MRTILDRIYEGELSNREKDEYDNSDRMLLQSQAQKCAQQLDAMLDDSGKKLLKQLVDLQSKAELLHSRQEFICGFRMGINLLLEEFLM